MSYSGSGKIKARHLLNYCSIWQCFKGNNRIAGEAAKTLINDMAWCSELL